jgi:Zinc carboxypeptidase
MAAQPERTIVGSRMLWGAVMLSALIASLLPAGRVVAQEPNQVTGLTVVQKDGYATVAWSPVDGATDYQIERTPVNEINEPTGASVITGLWRPDRQINQGSPTFADAGFLPGDRFQWRVQARFDAEPQPFSEPVFGTTLPQWGDPGVPGENLRTQWEETGGAEFTSDVNEYAYTAAIDAASDRVRVVEIGRTVLNRPINMFIISYPAPAGTAKQIARSQRSLLVNCNVHGNEPSGREGCLILARELAFGNDPRTIDILSNITVLIVPTINGDGRAANTRGNSTGQDLNRDFSLLRQPETFAFVQMLRDYQPLAAYDGHEFGNSRAGDLPMLPPRHLNVSQGIFDLALNMLEERMYGQGAIDGWWPCPYGCTGGGNVGLSQETILRNTLGLKNMVGMLLEARSSGGVTRPSEAGNAQVNRRRKGYSQLWTFQTFLDHVRANRDAIAQARREAIKFQTSNTGRIVFRGSRPIAAFPAPHPGQDPPPEENPSPDQILEDPPCGYLLTEEEFNGPRTDGATTVSERIEAHGWRVVKRQSEGYLVPLAQPDRGLIPLLLDAQAAEEWAGVDGDRMFPPPGFPEGEPVPDQACRHGISLQSAVRPAYDLTYDTD